MLSNSKIKTIMLVHARRYADSDSYNPPKRKDIIRISEDMECRRMGYRIDWTNKTVTCNSVPVWNIVTNWNAAGNMNVKFTEI